MYIYTVSGDNLHCKSRKNPFKKLATPKKTLQVKTPKRLYRETTSKNRVSIYVYLGCGTGKGGGRRGKEGNVVVIVRIAI